VLSALVRSFLWDSKLSLQLLDDFCRYGLCRMRVNNATRAMPNINIPSNSRTSDLVPMTMMYSSEAAVHSRCWQPCFEIRTERTPQDHAILLSRCLPDAMSSIDRAGMRSA